MKHEKNQQNALRCVVPAMLLLLLALAGCRSPALKPPVLLTHPRPVVAPERPVQSAWAEIAYVNEAQGYVVLRAKVLQNTVGEATVRRGTNEVARLRVGGPARPPWLTADILSGHPQPRDRVEMKW